MVTFSLAPPTGQNWTFVNTVTFVPLDRFSKMRYHWIPWIKTNSTHPVASTSLYIDIPLFPVLSKTFERHHLLQFLSNLLQNHQRGSSDQASQNIYRILILTTVCPYSHCNSRSEEHT